MATALDLITDVFYKMKVYAPGQTITGEDSAWALTTLNDMFDSWSNDSLTCYANTEQSFILVPGKSQYTIGTGGDINSNRPISIQTSPGTAYLVDTNSNRFEVSIIEQDKWNQISLLTEQSDLPDTLFYNPQYPLGIINLFPVPSAAYTLKFIYRMSLANISTLTGTFSLPPGYLEAIKANLLIRLWNDYRQGDPPAVRIEIARTSLANIKRTNIKISPSSVDSAIVSRTPSSYNIYTDAPARSDR